MPKYWVKNYFAHGRFPEVGQKQKTEKERKRERKLAKTMAKLRMAHASTHGARKPPGPILVLWFVSFYLAKVLDKVNIVDPENQFSVLQQLHRVMDPLFARSLDIQKLS